MIKSIQFIRGYPLGLDCIQTRRFEFTPGVNVLFGPNGCGKSTIVKTLKGYCGIEKGGWTSINDPAILGTQMGVNPETMERIQFPHAYDRFTPGNCRARVAWDGTPTFFNDGDIKVSDVFFFMHPGQSDDGITSEMEQFEALAKKPSTGQYRIARINKMFSIINKPADVKPRKRIAKPHFTKLETAHWESLGMKGPITVLLDEPERSLSLPKQHQLFIDLIPKELNGLQVIIATHSIFALNIPNVNVIGMVPGYVEECLRLIQKFNNV